MHSCHQTLLDAKVLVDHLGQMTDVAQQNYITVVGKCLVGNSHQLLRCVSPILCCTMVNTTGTLLS